MDNSTHAEFNTPYGTVAQVPIGVFLNQILPPLRHDLDLGIVSDTLDSTGKTFTASNKLGKTSTRWKAFSRNPARIRCPEERSFEHFEEVVATIIAAGSLATHSHPPTMSARCTPLIGTLTPSPMLSNS